MQHLLCPGYTIVIVNPPMCQFANWCYSMRPFLFTDRITKLRFQSAVTYHAQLESVSVETYSYPKGEAWQSPPEV